MILYQHACAMHAELGMMKNVLKALQAKLPGLLEVSRASAGLQVVFAAVVAEPQHVHHPSSHAQHTIQTAKVVCLCCNIGHSNQLLMHSGSQAIAQDSKHNKALNGAVPDSGCKPPSSQSSCSGIPDRASPAVCCLSWVPLHQAASQAVVITTHTVFN